MFSGDAVMWLYSTVLTVHDTQDRLLFFGLQVDLSEFSGVFLAHYPAVWILLHKKKIKPEGGGCLWRMEFGVASLQVSNSRVGKSPEGLNIPTTIFQRIYIALKHRGIILSPVCLLT